MKSGGAVRAITSGSSGAGGQSLASSDIVSSSTQAVVPTKKNVNFNTNAQNVGDWVTGPRHVESRMVRHWGGSGGEIKSEKYYHPVLEFSLYICLQGSYPHQFKSICLTACWRDMMLRKRSS